jgi:hypothetical protein
LTKSTLSEDDIAAIVKDDTAFRTWTMVKIVSLDKDLGFLKRVLSPSLWANVIMAIGALVTITALLIGHYH